MVLGSFANGKILLGIRARETRTVGDGRARTDSLLGYGMALNFSNIIKKRINSVNLLLR